MGLQEKLIEAFAAEHPELLARIRATLDGMASGDSPSAADDLNEAFRAAHSLKGAARVCDLAGIHEIGSVLQDIIGRVRDGKLTLSPSDLAKMGRAVEAAEKAGAAAVQGVTPPDTTAETGAIREILETPNGTPSQASSQPEVPAKKGRSLADRLLAAFQAEHQEHLETMRSLLASTEGLAPGHIDEIFRCAHSLKGAARVNDLGHIQQLAHELETLFSRVRDGETELTPDLRRAIGRGLDAIEDAAAAAVKRQPAPDTSAALRGLEQIVSGAAASNPATDAKPVSPSPRAADPAEENGSGSKAGSALGESIRIDSGALDRILDSAGQLITESLHQESIDREIEALFEDVERILEHPDLAREWIRRGREARRRRQAGTWALGRLAGQLQRDVRGARFIPAATVFQGFRKMARDLGADEGKSVDVEVNGLEVEADRAVLQALKDPVMHLFRNAVSHGIEKGASRRATGKPEEGRVSLSIRSDGNRLRVVVEDDGAGIDYERVREIAVKRDIVSPAVAESMRPEDLAQLIFNPRFSTSRVITEASGRGMGLSVVSKAVTGLQGEVTVGPGREGVGTAFVISVPLTLATQRLIMLECQGQSFGIPCGGIEILAQVPWEEVQSVEGHPCVRFDGDAIPLVSLDHLLGLPGPQIRLDKGRASLAVINSAGRRLALAVDSFLGVRDAIVKDLPGPASFNPGISGAVITEDGSLSLVLNPLELVRAFSPGSASESLVAEDATTAPTREARPARVLVVDDSFTTRTLEKSLLEAHGYQVRIAVDGVDGLARLREEQVDLAIIDVEMPRMDGFTLLGEIKKDVALKSIPVIMVTSLETRAHIERGLDLGAAAYIVKRKFDHQELLDTIRQIL